MAADIFSGIGSVRSAICAALRTSALPHQEEAGLRRALLTCDAIINGMSIPDIPAATEAGWACTTPGGVP